MPLQCPRAVNDYLRPNILRKYLQQGINSGRVSDVVYKMVDKGADLVAGRCCPELFKCAG